MTYKFTCTDLEKKKALRKSERTLVKIGDAIKKIVPFEAEMNSETIIPPTVGDQADCNTVNTCHVDAFLYDEEEIENLVKGGKLKRFFCLDCHSRNVKVNMLLLLLVIFLKFIFYFLKKQLLSKLT